MFGFDYVPEDKLSAYNVIDEGEGWFKIVEVSQKVSNNNNNMLVLGLALSNDKGQKTLATEYITAKAAYKLHDICHAIGKPELYNERGQVNEKLLEGHKGNCIISTDMPSDPKYKPKSVVSMWLVAEPKPVETINKETGEVTPNDAVPF